ncbi:MAG TPA: HIT family protein [Chloroflexi bacterium]|nr:HIT family protein [Chloroflexota bacterium]
MEQCVFCDIVAGLAPASMIYQDDKVAVFLSHQPVTPGHTLVIPCEHATHLADMDEDTGAHLFRIAMRMNAAIRHSSVRAEGVRLSLSDGRAAGQVVMHTHLHLIPRFAGDGAWSGAMEGARHASRAELDETAAEIARAYRALYA